MLETDCACAMAIGWTDADKIGFFYSRQDFFFMDNGVLAPTSFIRSNPPPKNDQYLLTFEDRLRQAVNNNDANAIGKIFNEVSYPTDIKVVEDICIDAVRKENVTTENTLKALAGFRKFDREAIPSFVFQAGLEADQVLLLAKCFWKSGSRPNIADHDLNGSDRSFVPLAVKEMLNRKSSPHFYQDLKYAPETSNLNCQIIDANGNTFACRHIETYVGEEGKKSHKEMKGSLITLSDKGTASAALEGKYAMLQTDYNEGEKGPNTQFSHDQFGALVNSLADSLQEGGSSTFPLIAQNHKDVSGHAMMLYLRKKDVTITIGVYDPNISGNMKHIKLLAHDKQAVSTLGFQDFVDKNYLSLYCGDSKTLSIAGVTKGFAEIHAGKFVGKGTQFGHIADALAIGNAAHIRAIACQLVGDKDKLASDIQTNRAMLKGALFVALQEGHADAIRAVGELLLLLKNKGILDVTRLGKLLAAKSVRAAAKKSDHADAVKEYDKLRKLAGQSSTSLFKRLFRIRER